MNRREHGQATVEFALVLPVLLIMLLVLVQVAVLVRNQILVQVAAREAVRAASVDPEPGAGPNAGTRVLSGVRVTVQRSVVGEPVTVEVSFIEPTDVPVVGPMLPPVTLRARAVMRAEQ